MSDNYTICCREIEKQLESLPKQWRLEIAKFVCSYLEENNIDCEDVINCQTVTSLSEFTVSGTNVCISYTDENLVTVNRCFDFEDVLNSTLDEVDPQCLMTQAQWNVLSYTQRWQAMVTKVCEECTGEITTTSTTTTSSTTT